MKEHHRQACFVGGNLIEHVGVVHMGSLSGTGVLPLVFRVKGSIGGDGDSAGGEDTLFGNHQIGAFRFLHGGRYLRGLGRRLGGGSNSGITGAGCQ